MLFFISDAQEKAQFSVKPGQTHCEIQNIEETPQRGENTKPTFPCLQRLSSIYMFSGSPFSDCPQGKRPVYSLKDSMLWGVGDGGVGRAGSSCHLSRTKLCHDSPQLRDLSNSIWVLRKVKCTKQGM